MALENTKLWEDYLNGQKYQSSIGISADIPKFVDFYEGRQWAAPTEKTKNLPRPVINIIKMICRSKKSAILSVPVKLVYKLDDNSVNMDQFNNFAEYIQKEIGQKMLDKRAIDDAVKKGSYFYHYYWDAEARGMRGEKIGGLRCEIIDPLNIFFSNPQEIDEQKQEWIIIASREKVEAVREKADKGVDKSQITPDELKDKYSNIEQEGSKLCTVLTRYFRKNGEVYCEKATCSVVINKPFSITPDIEKAKRELASMQKDDTADEQNTTLADNPNDTTTPHSEKSYLYPIVAGCYEYRERSIYGIGEVEGLIPNQKAINFNLGMMLLSAQETAWGKYIVLPDALRGQMISNEPGQILIDWTKTGNGIRKMSEQQLNTTPLTILSNIMDMTRTVTGATEVMSGEVIGANMSGSAIAQLQSQAQKPIEDLRNTFFLVKEKQGKVLAQFFKHFYMHREFSITKFNPMTKEEETMTDFFNSSDYIGKEINVIAEATSGTNSSSAGDINTLDTLYAKGEIDAETYIRCYPEDAIGNKQEILKGIQDARQNQLSQALTQLRQCREQMQQMALKIQEDQKTVLQVSAVIKENEQLRQHIANLYTQFRNLETEATQKLSQANDTIRQQNQVFAKAMAMPDEVYK